ncbi:MAG: DUF6048 family protein [Bacteroidota bacterium]
MKLKFLYCTSIFILLLFSVSVNAQNENETNETTRDTLKYQQKYGLRVGGDLGRIIRSVVDEDYTGFEINGDYRISKDLYIAGELGTEERTTTTDFLDVTTTGSYFKAGVDLNTYTNWLDMQNLIFIGGRVGASTFSQTINEFTIYDTNREFFNQPYSETPDQEFNGLSAIWTELIVGIKAELFNNLYMGLNMQLKFMITQDQPSGFENLFVPGFNRTYDSGRIGVGVGYNISYLIPIYKKDKKVIVDNL